MDKWFKDILPDKDPYHNRGRDQMRKKGVRNSSACVKNGTGSRQLTSSSVYRVYSSLSVILQRDSQDKSPAGQYLQLKTGGNLIYTVRNWAGGKLPSVSLNSSTELAVVAADGRLFHSRMDLGKKEFR